MLTSGDNSSTRYHGDFFCSEPARPSSSAPASPAFCRLSYLHSGETALWCCFQEENRRSKQKHLLQVSRVRKQRRQLVFPPRLLQADPEAFLTRPGYLAPQLLSALRHSVEKITTGRHPEKIYEPAVSCQDNKGFNSVSKTSG